VPKIIKSARFDKVIAKIKRCSFLPYIVSYFFLRCPYTIQLSYLYDVVSVQHHRSTRFSDVVTLARPHLITCLKVNNHSFRWVSGMNFLQNLANLSIISPYHSHLISHQFIIFITTTSTIGHSFSLPLQAQISPFL